MELLTVSYEQRRKKGRQRENQSKAYAKTAWSG